MSPFLSIPITSNWKNATFSSPSTQSYYIFTDETDHSILLLISVSSNCYNAGISPFFLHNHYDFNIFFHFILTWCNRPKYTVIAMNFISTNLFSEKLLESILSLFLRVPGQYLRFWRCFTRFVVDTANKISKPPKRVQVHARYANIQLKIKNIRKCQEYDLSWIVKWEHTLLDVFHIQGHNDI